MISPMEVPESYQQWITCLNHLQEHPFDRDALDAVIRGRMAGKPSEQFLSRVSDTASVLLTKCCQRFLRQLDQALEDGEPDMAAVLAVRFRQSVRRSLFYRELPFLEASYVQLLDEGFEKQLQSFWSDFLRQLKRSVRESMDPRMEDMALELSRVKITAERRSETSV